MGYIYEMHCHSKEASACSRITVSEMIKYYHKFGYSGLCLTDHLTGSSVLPDNASWTDRINHHYKVYEEAKAEAEKYSMIVFFAFEYSLLRNPAVMSGVTGNDFLILGLSKEWLLENEGLFTDEIVKDLARIRAAGGFVIHAHPFSQAEWIEYIRLLPESVDAVEIINGGCTDEMNQRAAQYAKSYKLLETAGSDTHDRGHCLYGVEVDAPCETVHDLITAIQEKKSRVVTVNKI